MSLRQKFEKAALSRTGQWVIDNAGWLTLCTSSLSNALLYPALPRPALIYAVADIGWGMNYLHEKLKKRADKAGVTILPDVPIGAITRKGMAKAAWGGKPWGGFFGVIGAGYFIHDDVQKFHDSFGLDVFFNFPGMLEGTSAFFERLFHIISRNAAESDDELFHFFGKSVAFSLVKTAALDVLMQTGLGIYKHELYMAGVCGLLIIGDCLVALQDDDFLDWHKEFKAQALSLSPLPAPRGAC